ncbi:MAG: prenyltransferase/squalene oxidase repeat-containing protein, partial [Planctomycetota bacterium]
DNRGSQQDGTIKASNFDAKSDQMDSFDGRVNELRSRINRERGLNRSSVDDLAMSIDPSIDPILDMQAPIGPSGLSDTFVELPGIVPSEAIAEIAAMDLTRDVKTRRDVGGPITPAGLSVAAVESFSRRVQRTSGGAAPAPAGMVGPATEEAIELGLAYLASTQNKDGSWSLQGHGDEVLLRSDTAATGLCLLAFQGAGYTHRQHQYASNVARALEFLINGQRTNGNLYRSEDRLSDQNVALYSHGIASLAVCEAYGMTQDSQLREPAQMCVDYIAATQHRKRGGWRYTPQQSSDTSVTGWMMMALKSGELSGLEVATQTYRGIEKWLNAAQVSPLRRDLYRYDPFAPDTPTQRHGQKPTPTMTSVGILMRMYSGWRRNPPDMRSAADYLLDYLPSEQSTGSPGRDTYYWYYATQVMFHMGGDYWNRWNARLNPMLTESQIKSGPNAGSWDPDNPIPDRWSSHAGRLYVTAMNLLNLEVYYRHLPLYEETGAPVE